MSNIITTLHPENDGNTNLYPNIKKENIPNKSVNRSRLDDDVNEILDGINDTLAVAVANITKPKYYSTLPTSDVGLIVYSDGYLYSWDINTNKYVSTGIVYQSTALTDEAVSKSDILNNTQVITPNNISNVFTYNKNALDLLDYWVKLVDGVITIQPPSTHKHIHMNLRNVKTISWVASSSAVYVDYGFIVMEDGTIKSLGYHAGTFDITGAKELYFNFFDGGDFTNAFTLEFYSFDSFNYKSCIDKSFSFNGSNIGFFGDSITKGHTSGTIITPNGFPKLFSDSVGATFVNEGVAGSTIAFVSGHGCICNKVMNSDLSNYDYIFIAGGINDWQLGVSITDFKTKLSELCVWLTSNYTGKVIFIAPINCLNTGTWGTNAINSIDVYRNIIAEYCITYGFSFVNGGEFNFSSVKNDFSNTLYGDGLHPSELGYKLYTMELKTKLC